MKTNMTRLLASMVLGLSSIALATNTDEKSQIRKDCQAEGQAEGQAAGLEGKDLEQFIQSCVEDLIGAELINVVK